MLFKKYGLRKFNTFAIFAQTIPQKAHYLLLNEVYRKALAIKIVNTVSAGPGNCGTEDKIEYIRKQFPNLKLDEITQKLKEMREIEERINQCSSKNNAQ